MRKSAVIFIAIIASANTGHASFLSEFKMSPADAYYSAPVKSGDRADAALLQKKIDACRRDESRQAIMHSSLGVLTGTLHLLSNLESIERDQNSADNFFDNRPINKNLNSMHRKYRTANTTVVPWSGDYWAIKSGMAAKRYHDPDFIGLGTWLESYQYVLARPASSLDPAMYSPAEKYDRLVGDFNFSLTVANWEEGKRYNDEAGEVEGWMGICHGWAPASYMEPRPSHSINLKSYDSTAVNIQLLPDDIKALLTLKWANGVNVTKLNYYPATRFIGGRCNVKAPQTDPETGRINDPNCFDLNPGTWHVVMVNQLGVEKTPLIIDASYDYEVWNQPVFSYSYTYFNPKTLDESDSISRASVKIGDPDFTDRFAAFRNNPQAVKIVGVVMTVKYAVETSPTGNMVDSSVDDAYQTATYHYDLELDANGDIVGGEWYQNSHPDFVWGPIADSTALNNEDFSVRTDRDVLVFAPAASRSNVLLKHVLDAIMSEFHQ